MSLSVQPISALPLGPQIPETVLSHNALIIEFLETAQAYGIHDLKREEINEGILNLTVRLEGLTDPQKQALLRAVAKLTFLRRLDLFGNNITELPLEMGDLVNLLSLDLSYNKLTELPFTLLNLTKLKVLTLCNNQLSKFSFFIIAFTDLTYLTIDQNPLDYRDVDHLIDIDCSEQRLPQPIREAVIGWCDWRRESSNLDYGECFPMKFCCWAGYARLINPAKSLAHLLNADEKKVGPRKRRVEVDVPFLSTGPYDPLAFLGELREPPSPRTDDQLLAKVFAEKVVRWGNYAELSELDKEALKSMPLEPQIMRVAYQWMEKLEQSSEYRNIQKVAVIQGCKTLLGLRDENSRDNLLDLFASSLVVPTTTTSG